MDYKALQNGSDIRGVAMEGVEGQAVNLTDQAARDIGAAFVVFLKRRLAKDKLSLSVGRDPRLSGKRLLGAFADGVLSQGADLTDFGLSSTPAMFLSTVTDGYAFDGAVMLTASHLPFNRNGLKFFTRAGGLEKQDIAEILSLASQGIPAGKTRGQLTRTDFLSVYAGTLVDFVRRSVNAADYERPLKGFSIVVDAGNGAGGFYAGKVLAPLGADVSGSQFLEPDGQFPNHTPNPEDARAMESIAVRVREINADFGIIFDTDVDRAGAVATDGTELNRNRLIALIAAAVLEEHPGTTIVTDSITSTGLTRFIAEKGGVHHRFKRGYRNVINEAIRLNNLGQDCRLAIETSGHAALRENYFLDDGAYLVTKLLIKMAKLKREGRTLLSLIDTLPEPAESVEARMEIAGGDAAAYGAEVLEALKIHAAEQGWRLAEPNYEGVRVEFPKGDGDGWFLLRLSLHEPLLPLNIESDTPGGVAVIAKKLADFLARFDRLDSSALSGM